MKIEWDFQKKKKNAEKQNYGEVYVIDPRYFNDNLSDFVDKHKITDVIFINNMIAVGSQNRVDELNKLLK